MRNREIGNLTDYVVINTKTGEDLGYLSRKEIKHIDSCREAKIKEESKINDFNFDSNLAKNKDEFFELIDLYCGNFYFSFYKKILKLEYIFRFIYICTYMNYKNYIEFGAAKGENRLIKKKDLFEILNLKKTEAYETIKYLFDKKLLIEDNEGNIKVNIKFCKKGKITKNQAKVGIRMFEEAIRELYLKSKPTEHNKLALFIKLIPYVNLKYNVICSNPEEENIEKINPLTIKAIADIAGYKNSNRLKKELLDLTVNESLAVVITETKYGKFVHINPTVYYKGTNKEDLKYLVNVCKLKRKK
ncbi:hypothetical protein ACSXEK_16245 (plasmid) [Clostridium perfringens]|uniref:hypothetical protein n=1 Tax=Clostridium perfringens TaxID=1502 RepID=UPI003749083D